MQRYEKPVRERISEAYAPVILSREDLLAGGMSPKEITRAVRNGSLRRLRRDHYASPDVDDHVAEAVRIGGRLSCVSLLRAIGVFVLNCTALHVHVRPGASRLRRPLDETTVVHWDTWSGHEGPAHVVGLLDAVRHSLRCQTPRAAIATLDSLLHHGLVTRREVKSVIDALPARFSVLLALLDPRAESGPETFMRLILRGLGVGYETQVVLPGVGRVDFIVEGWLIIECDSREFHEGWEKQVEDRARDIAAARLGYVTIRPLASDLLYHGDDVRVAIEAVLNGLRPAFGRRCRS